MLKLYFCSTQKLTFSFDEDRPNAWETSCEVGVSFDLDDNTVGDGIHFQVGESGCCFIEDLPSNSFPPSCN